MRALMKLSTPRNFFRTVLNHKSTVTRWAVTALLVLLAAALPLNIRAQGNYVYVNNQQSGNSVVAYSVSPAGVLTAVPGSPFSTGGRGSNVNCYALDRIAVSPSANLLFVVNTGDQTITAFQINPATGALTRAAGSPLASGLTLDSCQGISLAATPNGQFLMASSNGQIKIFSVSATGALAPLFTTLTCCTPMDSLKISSNGQFLAAADASTVSVYTINADGSLTAVAGSPFPKTGTSSLAGLDFNSCGVNRLYGGEASSVTNIADAWSLDAFGALSPIVGSPFQAASGVNSNVVLMSTDNRYLFESNQFSNSVDTFTVNADGSLTSIGKFGGVGFLHTPAGLAADRSGTFLYVADDTAGVAILRVNGDGTLTNIKDQLISSSTQIQGVAAYPPRACASADLSIAMTATPDPVFANSNVTYTITLSNAGPSASAVTIADALPSTLSFVSCTATGGGVCVGTFNNRNVSFPSLASGASATVTIVARVNSTIANNITINNTASISNSSTVDPNPANNSASASVTGLQQTATTLTVANATGPFGGSATFSATLTRKSDNSPVAGKLINFLLNGIQVGSGTTDATGVASAVASLGAIKPGTYASAIQATFNGDAAFVGSTGRSTLTVTKATLTVTGNNASRLYGDPNPAFTYTITGFANGDTQAVVTGTASCTSAAVPTSPVGIYPIVCTQGTLAANNYSLTFVSGTLTVNPAPLSVTAANASRAYGAPNPAFTGTITGIKNGDNITATYSTTATTTSAPGTYPITPALVDPAGKLPNYAVTVNNGVLTVGTAVLSVTAGNATRAYGDANPVFTGTITGLQNGDNITATYVTTADPTSPIGTYTITPVLSDPGNKLANYTLVLTNGTLTVTAAPLTVTAANASRLYGDPNPAFTGTITGIKNGDNITATYASAADPTSPVGTYPIVPTLVDPTGKLANYAVTSTNGTLTVTAAPLTVTAANASRLYGDPNPVFTGTITGLKNGDNITATYSSVATLTSSVGAYPIVPALVDPTNKLANYAVTSNNGTLTVTAAPLTVTAANASRLYGDPNPAFTGTIAGIKNGDNITATYASAADPTSPVGTYSIVPTLVDPTGKLANYAVTSTNGTLTVTAAPLTVTAASIARAFGDPNPAFTGTITGLKNGDNITATYSTAATPSSPVGTYPIVPALVDPTSKLVNYSVTINNGTLTITSATLTVTAANTSMLYGDAVPVLTGTITGLKNGDTISATYATVATSASPIGAYPIVPALVDPNNQAANYTVVLNNGTLTINPAPLNVTAASISRFFGDPNPAFTGTITGIKNADNITATYASAATPASPVGFYAIVPTLSDPGNKLGNYAVTINNGTLGVNPAPLVVAAADNARLYGDPNPAFTGSLVGVKNGDNITATFDSPALVTSPVGTYPIVPTLVDPAGALSNYVVTSVNGTLTVSPAPLTIQAADAIAPVGGPFPTFTGTITGLKNSDVITASYTTTADATSPAGTYPITPGADPNPLLVNYAVTLINGTLTLQ